MKEIKEAMRLIKNQYKKKIIKKQIKLNHSNNKNHNLHSNNNNNNKFNKFKLVIYLL